MHIPAERLIVALRETLERMLGAADEFGSDQEAVRSALTLLQNRQREGVVTLQTWLRDFVALAEKLETQLALAARAPDLHRQLSKLEAEARAATQLQTIEAVEPACERLLREFASLVGELVPDQRLEPSARTGAVGEIGSWYTVGVSSLARGRRVGGAAQEQELTRETLSRYLADRFGEPAMRATAFRRVGGGFGKETILFSVEGRALSGEFVMRRDRSEPTVDNDCHRVVCEYPVIRAAFAHGFPAPDALWLDTEHALLPGGDFIVMRRSSGAPGGSVFGAGGTISDDLLNVLAKGLAGLHALPPLVELDDHTDSINATMWSLSMGEAARRYIAGFRDLYAQQMTTPSPAVLALYSWVLDRLPDSPGRPVLVHGDVGFHNMVLHEGRLTALVDWEFAHVGDPVEDLAYVRNTAGATLDWRRFLEVYQAEGGIAVDPERLWIFQVWGQLRNATASEMTLDAFASGRLQELKLAHTGFYHAPMFIDAACDLIARGPD